MAVVKRFVKKKDFIPTIIVVTILFFIWGLVSNLNGQLLPYMKRICTTNKLQDQILDFSFFGAYFIVAIPGALMIKKIGLKAGLILGLMLCALGALLFYPAAEQKLFSLLFSAIILLASGITLLQVGANPYITLLGKPKFAAVRLNVSQALNSLGASLAPFIGGFVLKNSLNSTRFASSTSEMTPSQLDYYLTIEANSIKPIYLTTGLLLCLFAFIFLFAQFPRLSTLGIRQQSSFIPSFKQKKLWFAVACIFIYVGIEVSIAHYISSYKTDGVDSSLLLYWYWLLMMFGRFIGAFIQLRINPSKLLFITAMVNIALLTITLFASQQFIPYIFMSVGLFNAVMFPNIFTLGIGKLNYNLLGGTSVLIMAIVGGAIIPFFAAGLGHQAFIVLGIICYASIALFGFWCFKKVIKKF